MQLSDPGLVLLVVLTALLLTECKCSAAWTTGGGKILGISYPQAEDAAGRRVAQRSNGGGHPAAIVAANVASGR